MGYKYLCTTYTWLYYCLLMGVQVSVYYLYMVVLLSPDGVQVSVYYLYMVVLLSPDEGTSICVLPIHGCTNVP